MPLDTSGAAGDTLGRTAITNPRALTFARKHGASFPGIVPKSLRIKSLDATIEDVVTYNKYMYEVSLSTLPSIP